MNDIWTPRLLGTPRQCLEPIFTNPCARQWLTQPFDLKRSPISTQYFSMAFQNLRGTKDDFWAIQNVALPVHIEQEYGFACVLNLGECVQNKDKSPDHTSTILSRTTVVAYKFHNLVLDCTHYANSTVAFMYAFDDEYGARHLYVFRLKKKEDGELDLNYPLKTLYEIGKPHCEYCTFFKDECQCSYEDAERAKIKVTQKPCNSFDNFCVMFSKAKTTETRIYSYDEHGNLRLVTAQPPQQRKFSRISAWDYIGPKILTGVMPIGANLISDHFNSLSPTFISKIRMLLNPEDSSIPSIELPQFADRVDKQHRVEELPDSVIQIDNSHRDVPFQSSTPAHNVQKRHRIQELTENFIHIEKSHSKMLGEFFAQPHHVQKKQRVENPRENRLLVENSDGEGLTHHEFMGNPDDHSSASKSRSNSKLQRKSTYKSLAAHDCPHCGKTLTTKANMKKHVKAVHEKIKELTCQICGATFHQLFNLKRHVQRNHQKINVDSLNFATFL